MVYHATINELAAAYNYLVGAYDAATPHFRQDSDRALTLANLRPGQSVLEIGAGSGRLITMAKQAVGNGFCVAVDAVQGLINSDIPWNLTRAGLSVSPSGTPDQRVHLLRALATDPNFRATVRALPGAPQDGFDCIFAMHILNTVPPGQRLALLRELRRLLKPGGCLVATMSARFSASAPSAADAGVPVLFRIGLYTEAPGSVVVLKVDGVVPTPRGVNVPRKYVFASLQISPDRLWTASAQQAHDAATAAGFVVDSCLAIGKGDMLGLPNLSGSRDQAALNAMPDEELISWARGADVQQGYKCVGRAAFTCISRAPTSIALQSTSEREGFFVTCAQHMATSFVKAFHPSLGEVAEHEQVGSLVVMRKL